MPFRTPRRRISPRTKRRVRAIKEFFKKTLGASSQTDCKTSSSIIISVSDLKSKIDIIEQQLDRVSKNCRDLSCLESSIKRADSLTTQNNNNESADTQSKSLRGVETRIIYKTPQKDYIKTEDSEYTTKNTPNDSKITSKSRQTASNHREIEQRINEKTHRSERKRSSNRSLHSDKQKMYRASSSVNLYSPKERDVRNDPSCSGYHRSSKQHTPQHIEQSMYHEQRENIRNDTPGIHNSDHHKSRKKKHKVADFDEEFIADIIRRQYKPVKLFGRRLSDYSQFSAPVCRDQEFSPRTEIEEGIELCSCCYEGQRRVSHRYCNKHELSDMRSICDARLYSSKRHRRYKQAYINDYNNSKLYDLVPVKEKTSPKSRRKFIEETMTPYECYKEVPPSPRTHRPRLNLKTQQYYYEDSIVPKRRNKSSPIRSKRYHESEDISENCSDESVQNMKQCTLINKEPSRPTKVQDNNLPCPMHCNDQPNFTNNDTLITQATESTTNKTDQALSEIKDILQTFLQEIKKECTLSNTQINKPTKPPDTQDDQKNNSSQITNVGNNFNPLNNLGQCPVPPFMPPYPNPCCYPILPICPINCSPNGYVGPTPSYTCANCATSSKETTCNKNTSSNYNQPHAYDETQELIKEIYKFVAQSPNSLASKRLNGDTHAPRVEKKILTSRSVGSSNASKRDVMVETPKMKCYSKSCEAIGSKMTTATYYSTNPSYSDTVLEKLSLEVSESSSETELDTEPIEKMKKHKFTKVLRKLGLFKRKKKDIIEEVSESESTVEVNHYRPNPKPPFQQHIMDYSMHGQEYFHPPPIPDPRYCRGHNASHRHACGDDGFGPRTSPYNTCKHRQYPHDHSTPHCYHTPPRTTAPCCNYDYDPRYHTPPPPPQVPLCLKEIEVKSTGTQSERKMSIFRKFKKKPEPRPQLRQVFPQQQHTGATQTATEKNVLFNLKALQKKIQESSKNSDPMNFSLKTQKQLAEGDMKMRNAMLKKLFYKRNPFSPRNLIIRTLLGKDKSSWGDPPKMYKPRMFI